MKNQIKLEELAMFLLGIYLFSRLEYAWWWFAILLLTPDFSMVGYAVNTRLGAGVYNLFHHKGTALVVISLGYASATPWVILAGVILWSHSCMDRLFGYGLKYSDDFKNTHLSRIGE